MTNNADMRTILGYTVKKLLFNQLKHEKYRKIVLSFDNNRNTDPTSRHSYYCV